MINPYGNGSLQEQSWGLRGLRDLTGDLAEALNQGDLTTVLLLLTKIENQKGLFNYAEVATVFARTKTEIPIHSPVLALAIALCGRDGVILDWPPLDEGIQKSIEDGNVTEFKFLLNLKYPSTLFPDEFDGAFKQLIEEMLKGKKNRRELFKALLAMRSFSDSHRGTTLVLAIRAEDLEIATLVWDSGQIPDPDRRRAIGLIKEKGKEWSVLLEIFSKAYKDPSKTEADGKMGRQSLYERLMEACRKGAPHILDDYLPSGDLEYVINQAILDGNRELIRFLLERYKLSQEERGRAIIKAIHAKRADLAVFFDGLIPPNMLREILRLTVLHDLRELFDMIVQNNGAAISDLPKEALTDMMTSFQGDVSQMMADRVLQILSKKISNIERYYMIDLAIKTDEHTSFTILLSGPSLPPSDLEKILNHVIKKIQETGNDIWSYIIPREVYTELLLHVGTGSRALMICTLCNNLLLLGSLLTELQNRKYSRSEWDLLMLPSLQIAHLYRNREIAWTLVAMGTFSNKLAIEFFPKFLPLNGREWVFNIERITAYYRSLGKNLPSDYLE